MTAYSQTLKCAAFKTCQCKPCSSYEICIVNLRIDLQVIGLRRGTVLQLFLEVLRGVIGVGKLGEVHVHTVAETQAAELGGWRK